LLFQSVAPKKRKKLERKNNFSCCRQQTVSQTVSRNIPNANIWFVWNQATLTAMVGHGFERDSFPSRKSAQLNVFETNLGSKHICWEFADCTAHHERRVTFRWRLPLIEHLNQKMIFSASDKYHAIFISSSRIYFRVTYERCLYRDRL